MSKNFDELAGDRLNAEAEKVLQILENATQAKRKVRIERACSKCGCSHIDSVEIEDHKAALEVAKFLAERGIGKPTERHQVDVNVRAVQTLEDLEALSLAELAQRVHQLPPRELPPAA